MRGADCSYGPYFSTDYSQQTHIHTHTHALQNSKNKTCMYKVFFSNKRRHWVKDAKGRQYNINRYTNIQQWDCHMSSKYSFVFSTNGIYRKSAFFLSCCLCVWLPFHKQKTTKKKRQQQQQKISRSVVGPLNTHKWFDG